MESLQVISVVVVLGKHDLAVVAALNDMMWTIVDDQSGLPRHEGRLSHTEVEVKNRSVAFFPYTLQETSEYDAVGNLVKTVNTTGIQINCAYDALNRQLAVADADGTHVNPYLK